MQRSLLVRSRQLLGICDCKAPEGIDDTHFVLHTGCDSLYVDERALQCVFRFIHSPRWTDVQELVIQSKSVRMYDNQQELVSPDT